MARAGDIASRAEPRRNGHETRGPVFPRKNVQQRLDRPPVLIEGARVNSQGRQPLERWRRVTITLPVGVFTAENALWESVFGCEDRIEIQFLSHFPIPGAHALSFTNIYEGAIDIP